MKKIPQIDGVELRRVAEARLAEKPATDLRIVEEPLRLLHELQVHQIELEMQLEELSQARGEVETALKKFTDLYDFAPVGYFTLGRNGAIRSSNLTGSRLVGVERSMLIGHRFGNLVSQEARSVFADFLDKVFAIRTIETCEVTLLTKGNSELFVQIDGLTAASGDECRIALTDISERKRAIEALRQANETVEAHRLAKEAARVLRLTEEAATELRLSKELSEATARTKSQFFANMSHELRTPMAGILGMLQIALREELAPAPREYVELALSSARSLLHILNDILDMSKIEAGKLTIEEEPFSLRGCLNEAIDIISLEVNRKGLNFSISVAEEIPDAVVGDHARLRQILLNLIGNAVKFTEEGMVEVRVTADNATSDGKWVVTFAVADTGIGIPDDKKHLLFQAFSQVDASHSRIYGGTGLGLAICKEIVGLMGGTITIESEEEVGSTFSFTINLDEAGLETGRPAEPGHLATETITVSEGERIPHLLLAEDDPNNRKALGLLLKWANYSVDFAEDGLKAIEMWEQGKYDLVLMDLQMPHMNGLEATRAIREKERERGSYTPIIAMTAHAFKEDEEMCLAGGMDNYISKPIDVDNCIQLISQIIRQKSCRDNSQINEEL